MIKIKRIDEQFPFYDIVLIDQNALSMQVLSLFAVINDFVLSLGDAEVFASEVNEQKSLDC